MTAVVSPTAIPDTRTRMPDLFDVPEGASERLRSLHVALVGLGSVGDDVADALLRMNIAALVLVDPAHLKPESLLTHRAAPVDIGARKVDVVAERARVLGCATRVSAHGCRFEDLCDSALVGAELLVLAGDNAALELAVAERCARLSLPLLMASVHGGTLTAQVRALANTDPARGACLVCGFGEWEFGELERGTVFSCAGAPSAASAADHVVRPTRSLRHLCALAANLAVAELVRRTVGLVDPRDPVADVLVEHSGYTQRLVTSPLVRNPSCPCEHVTWRQVAAPRPLARCTLRELLDVPGAASLEVEGFQFARAAACDCDEHPVLGRFLPHAQAGPAPCGGCGHPLAPHPFHTWKQVPAAVLGAHLDRRLAELGAAGARSVLVRGELGGVRITARITPPITGGPA